MAGEEADLSEEAHRRANGYAPSPRQSPAMTGLTGAGLTSAAIIVFGIFAGIEPAKFGLAFFWTIGAGFACGYLWARAETRKHERAWSKEYEFLRYTQRKQSGD